MDAIDSLLVKLLAVRFISMEMALSNLNVAEYEAYVVRSAPEIKFVFEQYTHLGLPSSGHDTRQAFLQLKENYYQQFHLED